MARSEIALAAGARIVITKDEQGPQEIYDRLATAKTALVVTYNLPKADGPLLSALENATQLESLRLVTNIPNWWPSYWSEGARQKARDAIDNSIARLNALAEREGVEIYFSRRNHSKIYVLDDIGYVGSSNFSDESADNVEAGVVIEDEDALSEIRTAAWELLKPEAQLHPTLVAAVAASLEDWVRDELQFESINLSVQKLDPADAQAEFQRAVERLLEFAHRAEAIVDDVRDAEWAEPLQAVIREATSLDEITTVIGNLEYSYGKIQACINFSFDGAIHDHIVANYADEETLDAWEADGRRSADDKWEALRDEALEDLRRVLEVLEGIRNRVLTKLRALRKPVDNTGR